MPSLKVRITSATRASHSFLARRCTSLMDTIPPMTAPAPDRNAPRAARSTVGTVLVVVALVADLEPHDRTDDAGDAATPGKQELGGVLGDLVRWVPEDGVVRHRHRDDVEGHHDADGQHDRHPPGRTHSRGPAPGCVGSSGGSGAGGGSSTPSSWSRSS